MTITLSGSHVKASKYPDAPKAIKPKERRAKKPLDITVKHDAPAAKNSVKESKAEILDSRLSGAFAGFVAGCSATVIGIPLATVLVLVANGKISAKKSRFILSILIALCLPGVIVGALGAGIGALVGELRGRIKARRQKHLTS